MEVITVDRNGEKKVSIESYECGERRVIRLTGGINSEMIDKIISKVEYLDSISNDDIYIYINSPGGVVTDGFALIDVVNRLESNVIYVAQGQAASMAAFILASGKKGNRKATPNTEIMLHQVLGGTSGQASDIELAAKQIKKTKNKINSLLSEWTGKDFETIEKDTDRDYFMSAEEALAYGIIDEIIT